MGNNANQHESRDSGKEQEPQQASDYKALQRENEALKERNQELEEQNQKLLKIIEALRDIDKHVSGEKDSDKDLPKPVNDDKPIAPLLLDPVIENQIVANLETQDKQLIPHFEKMVALLTLNAQLATEKTHHEDPQLES